MQSYLTITGEYECRTEINRSVFICNIKGIESFEEGLNYIQTISKKYSDATHNCYSLRTVDGRQKFSDGGEPSGTAGLPILQAIKNNDLQNIVAVVTRYFGGIKLGAAGLIGAYTESVVNALNKAERILMKLSVKGTIKVSYNEHSDIINYIRNAKYKLLDTEYVDTVTITFAVPEEDILETDSNISSMTQGRFKADWKNNDKIFFNY